MTNRLKSAEPPTHTGSLLVSIFATIFVISPAFTSGVPSGSSSANCDNATLGSNSGAVGIEINWEPNEIALHWYDGDNEITSGVQTSCTYDGALTPPATIPQKTGYTFKGWRVRRVSCTSITDETICGNTNGCAYYPHSLNSCRNIVSECSALTSESECIESNQMGGIPCHWNGYNCIVPGNIAPI